MNLCESIILQANMVNNNAIILSEVQERHVMYTFTILVETFFLKNVEKGGKKCNYALFHYL